MCLRFSVNEILMKRIINNDQSLHVSNKMIICIYNVVMYLIDGGKGESQSGGSAARGGLRGPHDALARDPL